MAPTLLLIGSGPGIGLSTASLFASKKFSKVALISRDAKRLVTDREKVLSAAPAAEVRTWDVDITESAKYKKVLKEVEQWSGEGVDCVIFNAARVAPSALLEFPEEELLKDFAVRFYPAIPLGMNTDTSIDNEHSTLHNGSMGSSSAF